MTKRLTRSDEDRDWILAQIDRNLAMIFLGRWLVYQIRTWIKENRSTRSS